MQFPPKVVPINPSCLKFIIQNAAIPGPPTDGSYQSTCVFLLLFERDAPHFLAIQKSDTEGYPWRNQMALPGGHLEKQDSSPVEAAYRELEEELSIPKSQVEFIGSAGHFQTILRPKDLEVFVGLWNKKGPIRCDSKEVARILEIPLNRIVQTHKRCDFHNCIPNVHDLKYPFEDVVIRGVTAKILHHLIEMLYPWLNDKGEFHI